MNQSTLIKIATVIGLLMIAGYLLWFDESNITSSHYVSIGKNSDIIKVKALIEEPEVVMEEKPKVSILSASTSALLISKVYAAELNFPAYSQPLKPTDFDRLNPNFFNPQIMPINDEGGAISASLSKYRYSYPEPIIATLEGADIESASFTLIDTDTKKTLLSESFNWKDNTWQLSLVGKDNFPENINASIVAIVGSKSVPIILALQYINPVAIIESFELAKAEGADMVIAANIHAKESGLYRIRANLFDANDQPIAHLTNKRKLHKGSQTIPLKAHQSVLQGKEAPFYLSTFMIELMSPSPGVRKKFGESLINKFEINDFAISSLDTSSYEISQQEQQRLELLQVMANEEE